MSVAARALWVSQAGLSYIQLISQVLNYDPVLVRDLILGEQWILIVSMYITD
jgi:hypothetical protein